MALLSVRLVYVLTNGLNLEILVSSMTKFWLSSSLLGLVYFILAFKLLVMSRAFSFWIALMILKSSREVGCGRVSGLLSSLNLCSDTCKNLPRESVAGLILWSTLTLRCFKVC